MPVASTMLAEALLKRCVTPSWPLPTSYPTRANGIIIVLLNSKPRLMLFSSILFVVPRQAKETIDRASNELHRWTFEIRAIFLPRRRVKTSDKHSILLLTFLRSVSKIWSQKKIYAERHLSHSFSLRVKRRYMDANRDPVKQWES